MITKGAKNFFYDGERILGFMTAGAERRAEENILKQVFDSRPLVQAVLDSRYNSLWAAVFRTQACLSAAF